MIREILRTLFFQKVLDHLLSVALIMLLMMLAILSFEGAKIIGELTARVSSQNDLRIDVHYTLALTGEWPKDSNALLRTRPMEVPYSSYSGDELELEGGAIHIRPTKGRLAGETISMHPAVPANNAVGPISWVVGPGGAESEHLVQGDDATTVDSRWIPHGMK
jgi:hypothetical protein